MPSCTGCSSPTRPDSSPAAVRTRVSLLPCIGLGLAWAVIYNSPSPPDCLQLPPSHQQLHAAHAAAAATATPAAATAAATPTPPQRGQQRLPPSPQRAGDSCRLHSSSSSSSRRGRNSSLCSAVVCVPDLDAPQSSGLRRPRRCKAPAAANSRTLSLGGFQHATCCPSLNHWDCPLCNIRILNRSILMQHTATCPCPTGLLGAPLAPPTHPPTHR